MSEEAIRMAVSLDGYNYKALNGNQPMLDFRVISSTGGVRDPHILRCEDGKTFYMVVTDMVSGKVCSIGSPLRKYLVCRRRECRKRAVETVTGFGNVCRKNDFSL